ncbi:MAG: 7TM diverse intracellular signaling domain-containing protein [Halioglobus sp.]
MRQRSHGYSTLLHANNPLLINKPLLILVGIVTAAALAITILFAQYYEASLKEEMITPAEVRYHFDPTNSLTLPTFLEKAKTLAGGQNTGKPALSFQGQHWFYVLPPVHDQTPGNEKSNLHYMQIDLPWLDHVEVTVLSDGHPVATYSVGDDDPFINRPVAFRKPVIPLRQGSNNVELVVRIPAQGGIAFPAFFISEKTLEKQIYSDHFFYGAIFSAILVLGIYNLFVFFSLRDASYIHYIFYIYAFGALQAAASAMGQQYLWPTAADATTIVAHLLMALTNFTIVGFVVHFLHLKEKAPKFYHVLRFIALVSVLATPGLFFTNYLYVKYLLHASSFTIMALTIVCSTLLVLRKDRTALFMLASNIVLFPSITIGLLRFQAQFEHAIWAEHAAELAIVIEAIILSLGLADRIASLRIGRNRAEQSRLAEQRQFSLRMIRSQERQKRDIGQLLHDSFSHRLLNLKAQLGALTHEQQQDPALASAESTVNALLSDVRDLSHLIYPAVLDHLGFEAAISAVMRSAFENTDIQWQIDIADVEMSDERQLLLYRATQECTNNILKHANASECIAFLRPAGNAPDAYTFCVKDDGDGFKASSDSTFGLRMLKEHVEVSGGELEITSDGATGTRIEIHFR